MTSKNLFSLEKITGQVQSIKLHRSLQAKLHLQLLFTDYNGFLNANIHKLINFQNHQAQKNQLRKWVQKQFLALKRHLNWKCTC